MVTITTLRSFRINNFAVFDFAASYLSMYILAVVFGLNVKKALLSVIPMSLLIHTIIGLETELTKAVFKSKSPRDYLIAILVFVNEYYLYRTL